MIEFSVNDNQAGQRLDKVIHKVLKEAPMSFIYKILRKKNITLNHEKAMGSQITVFGDTVQMYFSQETYEKMRGLKRADVPLSVDFPEIKVLYEDNDVLIFIKPAGILSQKARPEDISVNEWVIWYARERGIISDSEFETFKPSVCNRLDRNTGGIMAAGLSLRGLQVLSALFRERDLTKYYYAYVKGVIKEPFSDSGYLYKNKTSNRVFISRSPLKGARLIKTEFFPVKQYKDSTLLKVHLVTGRSHQIRAHLSALGYPIIGDPKYGDAKTNLSYGIFIQCLFAYSLSFPECELKGISLKTFETEVPEDWPLGVHGD